MYLDGVAETLLSVAASVSADDGAYVMCYFGDEIEMAEIFSILHDICFNAKHERSLDDSKLDLK